MSSKNKPPKKIPTDSPLGTVFMGPSSDKESTLDKINKEQIHEKWSRRTESEYMERVRKKAALRVQTMLEQARSNAETTRKTINQWAAKVKKESGNIHSQAQQTLQEAENIRNEAKKTHSLAYEEGHSAGVKQALIEGEKHNALMQEAFASVLKSIQDQYHIIFEHWCAELVQLVQIATEVATGWIFSEHHTAILEKIIISAAQQLEEKQHIILRIAPKNKELLKALIPNIQNKLPEIVRCEIKEDASLREEDIILESRSGMVDSSSSFRQEEVKKILQNLVLKDSTIEKKSIQAIASTIEATEMAPSLPKEPEADLSTHLPDKTPITPNDTPLPEEQFTFPELEGIELPPDPPKTAPPLTQKNDFIHEPKEPSENPSLLMDQQMHNLLLDPVEETHSIPSKPMPSSIENTEQASSETLSTQKALDDKNTTAQLVDDLFGPQEQSLDAFLENNPPEDPSEDLLDLKKSTTSHTVNPMEHNDGRS